MHDPIDEAYAEVPARRGIYCNRTLNLRSIQAIGYDMDYTLVHYRTAEWESQAYEHLRRKLAERGWPVEDLEFRPDRVVRGLVIDTHCGNVVKANQFGYIKQAHHGTEPLSFGEMRETYTRTLVDLSEPRWIFLNTLFSISAAWMYQQLVDLLDADDLPGPMSYENLWEEVGQALDAAHLEGMLKDEITSDPERYVQLDPEMPLTLLDQKEAGNELVLITNSEWDYTRFMMEYAFDRYLPEGMTWRDLFRLSVVSADKPDFFSVEKPMFKVATEDGLLRPVVQDIEEDGIYLGGHAGMVESYLGLSGDQILFVGDHLFSDVNVSKKVMRWRTALVLRELEREIGAIAVSRDRQSKIRQKMNKKVELERRVARLQLQIQRNEGDYAEESETPTEELERRIDAHQQAIKELDSAIAPLVIRDGKDFNDTWGYLMRAGNDKSLMTRQLERYADIYTSRVSNFLRYTPYVFFRAPRGSLPHDAVDDPQPSQTT
jgi:HAD superfamily 5'-nucleotidase-like hydrolase